MIKRFFNFILELLSEENTESLFIEGQPPSFWQKICSQNTIEENVISFFPYQNPFIKKAIFEIKQKRNRKLLTTLVEIIAEELVEELVELKTFENFNPKYIIATPRSNNQKDFNHSEDIAICLVKELRNLDLVHIPKLLQKNKETKIQHHLKREERIQNLKNTMCINTKFLEKIKNTDIIIVDDVTTTGATFLEAKRVLFENGAKKILCVAIAH